MSQPRALNLVSVCLYALLAAAVYGGWKFGVPYYQGWRVAGDLADIRREAGRFIPGTGDPREESTLAQLRQQIIDRGVDEQTLQVYFAHDNESLHVEYTVVIKHPVGKPTAWQFHHQEPIVPVGR